MNQGQYLLKSRIGPLYLVASENALQGVFWNKQSIPMIHLEDKTKVAKILIETIRQLKEYFSGDRMTFDLPLDAHGTAFQKRVWGELLKIPYGKTLSYRDIAQKIKNHKAMRAVGSANGKNPISIIVPCHRVIAADGTMGGYAGGIAIKIKLLELEGNRK